MRGPLSLSLILITSVCLSCGTYSMLRSADTLPEGSMELNAGWAANQFGEVVPVAQAAIGVSDRVELVGQWELWNAFVEGRASLLQSKSDGIALTFGIGAGVGSTFLESTADKLQGVENDGVLTGSVSVGRRFGAHDLYLANRTMWLAPNFVVSATKLGIRLNAGRHFRLIVEGGATVHHNAFVVAEGALAIGTGW